VEKEGKKIILFQAHSSKKGEKCGNSIMFKCRRDISFQLMMTLYIMFFTLRGNSKGYDLNRNFPDYFKQNTKRTQPETEAVKDWISKIQFLLSGSLHGGALV
jgi:hypothetical protein